MRTLSRLPFTLAFLSVMVLANWLAGTWGGVLPPAALTDWGLSHQSLVDGEAFRLITGTYLSHDLGMALRQLCFAAVVIGAYEWTEGTCRAIVLFYTIDILGSLLVLFGVLPLLVAMPIAITEAELVVFDVGMSAGGFGLLGALAYQSRYRWVGLLVILLAICAKMLISFEPIADTAHLLCLGLGVLGQSHLPKGRRVMPCAER
ncbi:hypothetical protein [Pararhodobacter sp.]|uniref:hypothetical protein n=1 Tax=Pararhodobacter sp. TaxID=2127056 RepID=UPI002AFDDB33|nr:hypothetical protein [Pararhodobacter sp.]